jgi:sugar lactone lactonase YvrE
MMSAGRQGAQRYRRLAALCLLATVLAPTLGAGADGTAADNRAPRLRAQRVLDVPLAAAQVAVADGHLWVASRGGGLLAFRQGRIERRFDVGRGLPSALVHDLAVLGDGRLLAGTDRGLVLVDPRSGDSRPVAPSAADGRGDSAADLVVSSDRGSTAIFQLASVTHQLDAEPTASLWRWEGGRVQRWDAQLGPGLVATTGSYDRADGCLHVAGVQAHASTRVPWYARDCAGKTSSWRLADGAPNGTVGVAALARAMPAGPVVLIVVTQATADPASRRYVALEIREEGKLAAHCSNAVYAEPVTGLVRHGNELIVARRGVGVETLGCGRPRSLSNDPRLRAVTALASDLHAGLLVATDVAVVQVRNDGSTVVMAQSRDALIPADALPMQPNAAGTRVLLSSPTVGPLELERGPSGWQISRRWRAGHEVPPAVYGPAIYAPNGDVLVIARSQGILRLHPGGVAPLQLKEAPAPPSPLGVASTAHGLWLASGSTPFNQAGAGLHFVSSDGSARFVPLPDRQTQPSGRMLTWPDGRVWVGTRIGVIEADPRGTRRRVSSERVDALYRNEARNVVGAVGATIQHWDGERLAPVMFAIQPRPARPLGHPVDLVIDDGGRWVILYSGAHLVLLDSGRRFVATLDARSGVPPTVRRLTYLPRTDEVLIGSAREGVFSLR